MPELKCCVCGSAEVIAVKPGIEPRRFLDLFAFTRGKADVGWCKECWLAKFGTAENALEGNPHV